MANDRFTGSENRDPITDEPGAHPVGTGVGAAGGAMAGAVAGTVGGPIGMAVGGVAGAVVGGLAGKATAESVNPTEEEAYWRNAYSSEPYYRAGQTYDDYGPAYELGWSYRARYGEEFDTYDSQLASDWESRRGRSRLQWPEARDASRAAWDRADRDATVGTAGTDYAEADNDDVIDTLNDLVETCRDGEFGFNACAEHAKSMELKSVFQQRATDCSKAAAELCGHVLRLGGEPKESGTTAGALHRGWVALRSTLTGYDDNAMLDESERGEDHALGAYRKALKQALPADIRTVVQRQMNGAQRNHDQIKLLRDQYKARA